MAKGPPVGMGSVNQAGNLLERKSNWLLLSPMYPSIGGKKLNFQGVFWG
jgi:hypothetical protein